jgi:hypothetical protein
MTTNPERSKCSTRRLATIAAIISAGVIHPLAHAVAQREGDGLGDVVGLRGRELRRVCHAGQDIAAEVERSKNEPAAETSAGTFAATFRSGCLAALELEGVRLKEI